MQSSRRARIESVIRQELAVALLREVKDPRLHAISISRVELTPDAGQAMIYVSIPAMVMDAPDGEKRGMEKDILAGLASASGFLRKKLGVALRLRQTPELAFRLDHGLENALRVHELLRQINPTTPAPKSDTTGESEGRE